MISFIKIDPRWPRFPFSPDGVFALPSAYLGIHGIIDFAMGVGAGAEIEMVVASRRCWVWTIPVRDAGGSVGVYIQRRTTSLSSEPVVAFTARSQLVRWLFYPLLLEFLASPVVPPYCTVAA